MDINKVILLGRVGKDPEFFKISNGEEIGKIRLATGYSVIDKVTQQYKNITSWHNIVLYSQSFIKITRERVRKGTKIYVEGSIKYTEFISKDGTKREVTSIEISNFNGVLKIAEQPKTNEEIHEHEEQQYQQQYQHEQPRKVPQIPEDEFFIDDELPF